MKLKIKRGLGLPSPGGLTALGRYGPAGIGLLAFFTLLRMAGQKADIPPDSTPLHMGFSAGMFAEINANDAKASLKAWAQTVARERGIPVNPEPSVFSDVEAMAAALRDQTLDAVSITTCEYLRLSRETRFDPMLISVQGGKTHAEYLLLVRQDSDAQSLGDLRGRSLNCLQGPKASLALPWLDTILTREGFKPAQVFFSRVSSSVKLSSVVLPVFFRQTDACLVDRQGFDTMCELNPQLGKQLRTLASSPRLITMVFCFRSAYSPPVKNEIVRAMEELYTTPAGQQILTVFQIDRMQIASDSDLDSARELLDAYEQLAAVSRRPADDSKKPPSDGSQRQEQVSSAETARENH